MRRRTFLPAALCVLLWAGHAFAWSFAQAGDSEGDRGGVFPRILAAVDRSDMEFLIHTGDMVTADSPEQWDAFRAATATFRKPFRPVLGNHELYGGGTREKFARRFSLPGTSYSFTFRDAHFAIVDNAGRSLSGDTLAWLDRDLAAHPKGRNGIAFLVVAMHIPPETGTIRPHGTGFDYEEQSGNLLEILKKRKVDAVLCGHEHMNHAENWDGVLVVVSGGAGSRLFPLQRHGFYRIDLERGTVRERFIPVLPEQE